MPSGPFPRISPLPYPGDSAPLFAPWAAQPWSMFLDSGSSGGRFDILVADPWRTLVADERHTRIDGRSGMIEISTEDPLELLRRLLFREAPAPRRQAWPGDLDELPFRGGAMGYFAYDLVRRWEALPSLAHDDAPLPLMAMGIYDWAVVVDHERREAWLLGQGLDPRTEARWPELLEAFTHPAPASSGPAWRATGPLRSNMDREGYAARFARVRHYLQEGDCYQVNLAQRFSLTVEGDAWAAYRRLRSLSPAPYGAFLHLPGLRVLSNSPEGFLRLRQGQVWTRPIKGTRPRSADPAEDTRQIEALRASEKDRAENLMIVDLLRNDLGRNCSIGSVQVPELFALESFANVHHLVSTVCGRLAPGRDALDLLRGCFPGGSITGAPKHRVMQIIEELEPHRRGLYCGAIGHIGFDGNMELNIAIRSLTESGGMVHFAAGGGITMGSVMDEEYQETLDKASVLRSLLTGD